MARIAHKDTFDRQHAFGEKVTLPEGRRLLLDELIPRRARVNPRSQVSQAVPNLTGRLTDARLFVSENRDPETDANSGLESR